jgi:hypothetical protein
MNSVVKERGGYLGRIQRLLRRAGSRGAVCPPIDYRFWLGQNEPTRAGLDRNDDVSDLLLIRYEDRENLQVL